jgi:predicted CoA-substrate-specific enzyme activase
LLAGHEFNGLIVTGYGRHLVAPVIGAQVVTEIKAYAIGARHLYPDCRTVIDVGGQDSKVTLLSASGEVEKFEMNDRCAAGTGKFLEIMASTLEVPLDGLGALALSSSKRIRINSLCTVFAESEVVSLIAKGEEASAIAMGLHEGIADRIAGMARRVGIKPQVVFAGGGALNACLKQLLSQKLGQEMSVPPDPQNLGALGAALLARGW